MKKSFSFGGFFAAMCLVAPCLVAAVSAADEPYNYVTNGTFAEYYYDGALSPKTGLPNYGYLAQNVSNVTYSVAATPVTYIAGWTYTAGNNGGGFGYNGPSLSTANNQNATFSGAGILPTDPVLFVQKLGTLSTTLDGLTVGEKYTVSYQYSSRPDSGYGEIQSYLMAGGEKTILQANQHVAYNSGGFMDFIYEFTATAASMEFGFETGYSGNDRTTTFTNVSVVKSSDITGDRWQSPTAWKDDATSGIVFGGDYTHAFNILGEDVELNGVQFTGISGSNAAAGITLQSGFGVYNNNATPSNSVNSGKILNDFITNGANYTLSGLLPGYEYEMVIMTSSWGGSNRVTSISVNGSEAKNFNAYGAIGASPGVEGNNINDYLDKEGVILTWQGQANEDGNIVVSSSVLSAGNSWHIYGIANRVLSSPENVLMGTGFTGTSGTGVVGSTFDHANLLSPEGRDTWVGRGQANGADRIQMVNGAVVSGGNSGAGIEVVFPESVTDIRITADIMAGTLQGTDYGNARGVGIGFYDSGVGGSGSEVGLGFSGIVLSPAGELYYYSNMGSAVMSSLHAYAGFSASEFYQLSMDVHINGDGTATFLDLVFDGVSYEALIDEINAAGYALDTTDLLGFLTSSAVSLNYTGGVSSLMVTDISPSASGAVPEPATWVMMLLSLAGGGGMGNVPT